MRVLHFTPGSLNPNISQERNSVAYLPLASASGRGEISCLYMAPGGSIAAARESYDRLILVVNGRVTLTHEYGCTINVSAGMGIVLEGTESCLLECETGAVLITVEAEDLAADACGLSTPDRVMGQRWPQFESN
jgi:hypothetical protein